MKYIDIHSHLGFEDYGADRSDVLKRMKESEVGTIAIGADLASSIEAVKVATENESIWACIGQHPTHNVIENQVTHGLLGFDEKEFEKLVKNPKVVAIGECGLDYFFRDQKIISDKLKVESHKERQKEIFIKQINFALKYNKALMLHIRDEQKINKSQSVAEISLSPDKSDSGHALFTSAFDDAYAILESCLINQESKKFRGNVHFFTGKLDMAKKFIELGFTISFVGLITYVQDFDKIIKGVPLTSLQAETDAPYVAPVPHRGERNEPSYVIEVYKKIAEIRGEDPEAVRLQLLENAQRVFGI